MVANVVTEFACDQFGPRIALRAIPLRGGLETEGVARILVHRAGRQVGSFVAKPFDGSMARELDVYRLLKATSQAHLAPALLGWRYTQPGAGYLFLEWIAAAHRWPWRDLNSSALVTEKLAALHASDPGPFLATLDSTWNYEQDLLESAHSTYEAYRSAYDAGVRPGNRSFYPVFERVVGNLPRFRRELLSFTGSTLLHGDAHPGNVIVRGSRAFLLDWSRARIGSPLEDISSWIHSLAFWEPEARRRHDTLLKRYRAARGHSPALPSRDFRDACILAGACNALAGALRYHLAVLCDPRRPARQRTDSNRAAADWLRIIRRADICLRQQG